MIEYEIKSNNKIDLITRLSSDIDKIVFNRINAERTITNLNNQLTQCKENISTLKNNINNLKEGMKGIDIQIRDTNAALIDFKRIERELKAKGIVHKCDKKSMINHPQKPNTKVCAFCGNKVVGGEKKK